MIDLCAYNQKAYNNETPLSLSHTRTFSLVVRVAEIDLASINLKNHDWVLLKSVQCVSGQSRLGGVGNIHVFLVYL